MLYNLVIVNNANKTQTNCTWSNVEHFNLFLNITAITYSLWIKKNTLTYLFSTDLQMLSAFMSVKVVKETNIQEI